MYLAPLNGKSTKILEPIVKFAHENDVKICVNAGSSSLKKGFDYMKHILENAHIVVMNKEEAQMCTGIVVRPNTSEEDFTKEKVHPDVVKMLKKLKVKDYQLVVITDGNKGAYAYANGKIYIAPIFPSKVVSTLGAGDAFASTLCAALHAKKADICKALMYGSVNSSSVVSNFGASEGLLTFDEIEEKLKEHPEYKCDVIDA